MHSLASPSPIPFLFLPFVSMRTLPARAGSAHSATGMLAGPKRKIPPLGSPITSPNPNWFFKPPDHFTELIRIN
jgi:hypothetical protein